MKFSIMSRSDARKASFNLQERTAIVSINDFSDGANAFKISSNLVGICTVFFDDICSPCEYATAITIADAQKIKGFVDNVWGRVDHLIVHCFAGISRSSGCMSAILRAKGLDDSWIWESKKYCPNTLVAKKVLEAYGIDYNDYDKLWEKFIEGRGKISWLG